MNKISNYDSYREIQTGTDPECPDFPSDDSEIKKVPSETSESEGHVEAFPAALVHLRFRNYLLGFLAVVFALGFAFAEKQWKISVLSLFGAWFIYHGYTLEKRFRDGIIEEKLLICTSVHKSMLRNSVTVGFRSNDEYPVFYQYEVGGHRSIDSFHPNGLYLIYYNRETPSQLLAYTQL